MGEEGGQEGCDSGGEGSSCKEPGVRKRSARSGLSRPMAGAQRVQGGEGVPSGVWGRPEEANEWCQWVPGSF